MPSIQVDSHGIPAVAEFGAILGNLLEHAESVKPTASIEPALEKSDFGNLQGQLARAFPKLEGDFSQTKRISQFGIIETAVRDVFGKLVASKPIESPEFVKVWNLFDLLSILSDIEQCDAALLFWLVEELLDSQTIAGCRKIFDFLESRRQRITAKHFRSKQLVVLRSCNELLRRLSRAKDTAFCGRVFIFMFQCFPLGDKSSVNLRGEYHVENITTFDQPPAKQDEGLEKMDLDSQVNGAKDAEGHKPSPKPAGSTDAKNGAKTVDMDTLYPVFWSLQTDFSQPKKLFDSKHFSDFKSGLEMTLSAFKAAHNKQGVRTAKSGEEGKVGQRRKRQDGEEDLADTFNPKYLTSRDLFELELSDLTFRRHILVQALIIMDFLLSLSAEAKERLSDVKTQNKSVAYTDQQLSKEDTEWATKMKQEITGHLRLPIMDGAYFFRMVDTVLARDKNWVRWKIDSCPSIELPAVPPEMFAEAKMSAQRSATSKRLRATPMNALSIDFLEDGDEVSALGKFKSATRYQLPELKTFKRAIAEDDLEIDMPANSQTKAAAIEGKSSKSWRALRIASRTRLVAFDKIEDPEKVDIIFDDSAIEESAAEVAGEVPPGKRPDDTRPVIISGPTSVGKSSLVNMLLEKNPGVFGKVPTHTTRTPRDGEAKTDDYRFVDSATFNTILDGDQFLESSTIEGDQYGTSRRLANSITESGKIPLMQMSVSGAHDAKDMGYSARHILIKPPDAPMFESRLKDLGISPEKVGEILRAAATDLERGDMDGLYEEVVVNDELESAYTALANIMYTTSKDTDKGTDKDVEMHDSANQVSQEKA